MAVAKCCIHLRVNVFQEHELLKTHPKIFLIVGVIKMYLVPRMATALVFIVCARNEGLDKTNAQYVTRSQSATVFCGPTLTNAMQLVCNGVYNPMYKKSGGSEKRLEDWRKNEDNYAMYPFRTRRTALSLNGGKVFRRSATTIVNECCRKACTVMEMRNYCGR